MKKIKVPERIEDAVHNALASYPVSTNAGHAAEIACEAFAMALAEHPIVPTDEQCQQLEELAESRASIENDYRERVIAIEWQRIIFDAPEPEIPEWVKEMLLFKEDGICNDDVETVNSRIIEVYRRCQKS